MIDLGFADQSLSVLRGFELRSSVLPGVSYQLEQALGSGSMAVAFRAIRRAPDGQSYAVVKLIHPEVLAEASEIARLTIRKESVALGRLNEQVPPTPFVVRLLETSELTVLFRGDPLDVPWLAMEYVHGGTLEERISDCVARSGYAFDLERAASCVEALASGIVAIHDVGVIHRDLKPGNILCCGNGRSETFKIADFGVSRARGVKQTFTNNSLGTPGYAAPEQILMEDDKLGPATDVFALAATTFSLLTAEELFTGRTVAEVLASVQGTKRRSLRECARLVLDLRDQSSLCAAIDGAIAHATAPDAARRPQTAPAFATAVISALRISSVRAPLSTGRRSSTKSGPARNGARVGPAQGGPGEPTPARMRFHVRHALGDERAIWSAAWDASGFCLAATTLGLEFWDGTHWMMAPSGAIDPRELRLVHHAGAGHWLIGGRHGLLASYRDGRAELLPSPARSANLLAASGDFQDLAVVSGTLGDSQTQALFACAGGHWLRPLELSDVAALPALARLDEERWLVGGRDRSGRAVLAQYWPLEWRLERLVADEVRAYLAAASAEDGIGVVVGASGRVVHWEGSTLSRSSVAGGADLSATALEQNGRIWAACLGGLWTRAARDTRWECAWLDGRWNVPIVSLYADGRRTLGVAADGGMIEGLST